MQQSLLPGYTFLRRIIDLMKTANLPRHHVILTAEFKSDLHWWASFLPRWNGRSIVPQESEQTTFVHALTARTAKDPLLMHLLHCLHFFTATGRIGIRARHVPGALLL